MEDHMNTMLGTPTSLLPPDVTESMQRHIKLELMASQTYYAAELRCEDLGLDGAAAYFRFQKEEERVHAAGLQQYLYDRKVDRRAPALEEVDFGEKDLGAMLAHAEELETELRDSYQELKALTSEQDGTTETYIDEVLNRQRLEVGETRHWVDRFQAIGTTPAGLGVIDQELGAAAAAGA